MAVASGWITFNRAGFMRGDPFQDGLGDLPEIGRVMLDNRGRGLVPGEVGLL